MSTDFSQLQRAGNNESELHGKNGSSSIMGTGATMSKRRAVPRDIEQEVALSKWEPVTVARADVSQVQVTEADFTDAIKWLAGLYVAAGRQEVCNWYIDAEKGQRVKIKVVMENV